jgi:DNA repair exonuclease SbcCD ATPase subunit
MKVRIVHLGDIQVEIKTTGEMSQRLAEYEFVARQTVDKISKIKPDIVYFAGDIFQDYLANGDETKWFSTLLHSILPLTKRIIIIPGNHDEKQSNNDIIENGEIRNQTDAIDSVVTAINSSKISYYKHTGYYIDDIFDITWCVWSQIDKHSPKSPKPAYNPHDLGLSIVTKSSIDLYHDPIRNSIGFDGNTQRGSESYKIDLNTFKCHTNTVLAGDIHAPQIFKDNDFVFTYCSSLIQRNFGEGDYYSDSKLIVDGNSRHGFNNIVFDIEQNKIETIEFIPVASNVGRHTIYITSNFSYDLIDTLHITPSGFDYIRVECQGSVDKFFEHREQIIKHLSTDTTSITTSFSTDAISTNSELTEIQSVNDLIGRDKIIEIAFKYIAESVKSTTMLTDDLKDKAEAFFKKLFLQEFDKVDLSAIYKRITFIDADVQNFMALGSNVHINLNDFNIARITGTNTVGKTTALHFIPFMLTDLISPAQSMKFVKQNYLSYFNNKIDADTCGGTIRFYVNDDLHELTKTAKRSWKKGVSKWNQKDWADYVSDISVSIELKSNALTSTDTEKIRSYLSTEVLSYDDFINTMFINSHIIDKTIHRKSEELNQAIIENMGLTFFNSMLDAYDETREAIMGKMTKPTSTIDAIVKSQLALEAEIQESEIALIDLSKDLQLYKDNLQISETNRTNLFRTLKNVRTVDDINAAISDEQSSIVLTNQIISDTKTKQIQLLEKTKQSADINANLNLQLSELDKSINAIKSNITLKEQNISSIKAAIDVAKTNLQTLAKLIESENAESINALKLSLSQKQTDLANIKTTHQTELLAFEQRRTERISNINAIISDITQVTKTREDNLKLSEQQKYNKQNQINLVNQKLIDIETNIKALQTNTACSECGRDHDATTHEKIQASIKLLEFDANNQRKSIESMKADLIEIDNTIDVVSSQIADNAKTVVKYNADIVSINNEAIDTAEYDKSVQSINAEISELSQKITDEEVKLLTSVKADQRIIDAANAIKLNIQQTTDLQESINDLNDQIGTIIEQKTAISAKLIDIAAIESDMLELQQILSNASNDLIKSDLTLKQLNEELEFAKSDLLINVDISNIDNVITQLKQQILTLDTKLFNVNQSISDSKKQIDNCATDIQVIKKYQIADSVLKLYKRLVSKNGLPQYVFEHIIPIINSKLNDLMDGIKFRLFFDKDDLVMKMVDLNKNIIQPVTFSSGAETTFLGLSLISARQQLNIAKSCNLFLIDELAGTLNSGDGLSYNAPNYQQIFVDIIKRMSKSTKIMIVDHVLSTDIQFDKILEVQYGERGSMIVTR